MKKKKKYYGHFRNLCITNLNKIDICIDNWNLEEELITLFITENVGVPAE